MKRFSFEVVGRGDFPFDMLRYDNAFPVDGNAVEAIGNGRTLNQKWFEERRVRLAAISFSGPTVGRWNSFGWRVENIQKESLR